MRNRRSWYAEPWRTRSAKTPRGNLKGPSNKPEISTSFEILHRSDACGDRRSLHKGREAGSSQCRSFAGPYPHPDSVKKFLCFNRIQVACRRKILTLKDFAAESSYQRSYLTFLRFSFGRARGIAAPSSRPRVQNNHFGRNNTQMQISLDSSRIRAISSLPWAHWLTIERCWRLTAHGVRPEDDGIGPARSKDASGAASTP
jgi:hypothetical protein